MNIIQTFGLTKYYDKVRGVENLDLEVKSGEIFGFLGPNGAGKTTTIRALTGLITPDSGEIVIDGVDEASVAEAMRAAILAAAGDDVVQIGAGNYGGKLGKFHFKLHELLSAAVA